SGPRHLACPAGRRLSRHGRRSRRRYAGWPGTPTHHVRPDHPHCQYDRAPFPRRPVPVRFRQSTLNAHRRCRRTPVQLRFHSRFAAARLLYAQLLLAQYPPDSSAKTLLCRRLPNDQEYRVVVNYPAAVHPPAGGPPAWSPPAGMCSRTESGLHKVGTIHSSTTPPRGGSYNIPEVRVYVCSMTVDEGFNGTAED